MKGLTLTMVIAATLMIGCNSTAEPDKDSTTAEDTRSEATASKGDASKSGEQTAKVSAGSTATAAGPAYEEVKRGGHIYVVASKASADKVRAGQKLTPTVTAFGFGPGGERVYFETDKEGKLDQVLMAEFTRRHPKQ